MNIEIEAQFLSLEDVSFRNKEGELQEVKALHLYDHGDEHIIYLRKDNPVLEEYEELKMGDSVLVPCRLLKSGSVYKLKYRN